MSVQAITWAFEQSEMPSGEKMSSGQKLLLVAVANHADKYGVCYPGRKSLAADCSCTPQTVSENLGKLEEAGVIARLQRRRANGSRTSDWIVLAPEWGDRGALHDAPAEDFPPAVAARASGRESRRRSGRDFPPGQVGFSGGPEPSEEPSERTPSPEGSSSEPVEFGEWIGDHEHVTGHLVPRAGTQARAKVAAMFGARLAEGYSLADLKLATRGAHADEFRRARGYDRAESVLRPTKVHDLIEKGRRLPPEGGGYAGLTRN